MNNFLNLYTNIIYEYIDPNKINNVDDFKKALNDLNIGIGYTDNLNKNNFKLIKFLKEVNPEVIKNYIEYLNSLSEYKPDKYADGGAWWQEVDNARKKNESIIKLKDFFKNLNQQFKLYDKVYETEFSDIDENDYKDRKFTNRSDRYNDFSYEKNKIYYKSNDSNRDALVKKLQDNAWSIPLKIRTELEHSLLNDPNWKFTNRANNILLNITAIISRNAKPVYKTDNSRLIDHWNVDWENVQKECVKSFYFNDNITDEQRKEEIKYWIAALKAMKLNSIVKTFEKIQQKLENK